MNFDGDGGRIHANLLAVTGEEPPAPFPVPTDDAKAEPERLHAA